MTYTMEECDSFLYGFFIFFIYFFLFLLFFSRYRKEMERKTMFSKNYLFKIYRFKNASICHLRFCVKEHAQRYFNGGSVRVGTLLNFIILYNALRPHLRQWKHKTGKRRSIYIVCEDKVCTYPCCQKGREKERKR